MADYMSMSTLRFILHEVLEVEKLCALPRYKDYDKSSFDILLDSTKSYADKVMYPTFREMDEDPARYEDGKIYVHPVVGQVLKDAGENGLIGALFDYEIGGMQLPSTIHSAISHINQCANNNLPGYAGLTGGAAGLLVSFAHKNLIDTYVPNMLKGIWGGTMCLTEPQAGSSLSDVTTSAKPNEDGSYNIVGQKIFISGGDHEYVENMIHLVLARIEGAPRGTKGISLMVVPKKRLKDDGSLELNDVTTAGDFQKVGQRGYCTTHLSFGENNNCKGWLVGDENKGLTNMFQMMNGARIDVGLTGASTATAAYYASLQYAKERPQGRRISNTGAKNVGESQTLIINHPDVRRMLMLQKSIVEGSLALLMEVSMYHDLSEYGEESERSYYHDLLELLTPIAKTYPSEMGITSISNGLQVLGGYGFCSEFPLQQYYRDIRITPLYEGTTGIQSLDLLGRKVVMKNGEAMRSLTKEIIATISAASNYEDLQPYAEQLKTASKELQTVLQHLIQFAMKGEHERYIADASIFMEMMSTVVIAWQWLKLATTAKTALINGNGEFSTDFYTEQVNTMRFYFKYELPKILACKKTALLLLRKMRLLLVLGNWVLVFWEIFYKCLFKKIPFYPDKIF